jgi:iduronate 2-sulfatase
MGYSLRNDRYRYTEWLDREARVLARELYDHQDDPAETVNIADLAASAPTVERCSAQLRAGWRSARPG